MDSFILERYNTFRSDVIAWFYSLQLVTLVIQIAVYQPEWTILRPLVSLVRYAFFLSMVPFIGLGMFLVAALLPFIFTWFIFIFIVFVVPCAIPITGALVLAGFCYWVYRVFLAIPGWIGALYHHWLSCIANVLDRIPILMSVIGTISHLLDHAITCLRFLAHQQALCFSVISYAIHVIVNPMESLSLLMKRLMNLLWTVFIETPRNQMIRAARRLQSVLSILSTGFMQLFLGSYADLPWEVLQLLLRDYLMNGPVDRVRQWFRQNVEIPEVFTDMVTHSISNITLGALDGSLLSRRQHQDHNRRSVYRCTRSAPHLRNGTNRRIEMRWSLPGRLIVKRGSIKR